MGRSRSRKEKRRSQERQNNSSSHGGGGNSGGNSGASSGPSWAAWNKQKEKLETAEARANAVDEAKKKTEEEQTLTTKITAAIHSTMRMAGLMGQELPAAEIPPRSGAGLPQFIMGTGASSSGGAGASAITPMQLQIMAAQHGLQVVPGNDTPRQNMFNIPQQSAAGSILGGLGELSGIGAFRGLRRLDECGGGLLNGGMRGYGGRTGRSRSTSRRSSRTSDRSRRSTKDKKKTERRRPPSTTSSSASDKKNKKDKKSKDDKKDKKDSKDKKTKTAKGRANNETSDVESTGETGEEWGSRQPTRRNSGATSARGRGGGEQRAAGLRNFGSVLGETSPQTKWSQAARSLKESLNIVDTEAEPLLDSESEDSIELWATWCSSKCNAVQLDHLCRSNGITCRFEGKQKKIVRLLKWGVE